MARKHRQLTCSSYTTSIDTKTKLIKEMESAYTKGSMNTSGTSWITEYTSMSNTTEPSKVDCASVTNMPAQRRFVMVGQQKIAF